MASGTNSLKVVWICHFSNKEVMQQLNIKKKVSEFASWISIGIEEARKRQDIELHIVSPHRWIGWTRNYSVENIHYHFFNPGIPFIGRHWPSILKVDYWTNFFLNKKIVKKIVNTIKPDVINLHGFENAYYSSSIFQFYEKYPILVTVQGFISQEVKKGPLTLHTRKRLEVELKILKTAQNFGVRNEDMSKLIKEVNPDARLFWHEYFVNTRTGIDGNPESPKKYDLIFFGRVTKEKGVEDLIKIVGKLLVQFPSIKAVIVGGMNAAYHEFLKNLAIENHCLDHIEFTGYLATQSDVYNLLNQSKICILPTYNDIIPGTITESMFRKVAVVSYETGGIPEINSEKENILITKAGDLDGLVKSVTRLLTNETDRLALIENAYRYAHARWNNAQVMNALTDIYKELRYPVSTTISANNEA